MKVLGLSTITSLGVGIDPLINRLIDRSSVPLREKRSYSYGDHEINIFDYRSPHFNLGGDVPPAVARRLGLFAKLTYQSINLAIEDSGVDFPDLNRVGLIVGSGCGPTSTNSNFYEENFNVW